MTMEKTYFDGVSFESRGITVERVKDPIPEMREELEAKPNGHGSYLNSLTMSPREITLECRYFGDRWQDFDDMMDDLAAWLITEDDRPMSLRNNPGQHYMAHFLSFEEGDREGGSGIGGFTLTFTASDPLRHGEERAHVVRSDEPQTFEVGGTDRADLTVTVMNTSGSRLTASFSTSGSDYAIDVAMPDPSPHVVTLDCANHVCRVDGGQWGVSLDSDWPDFQPGRWRVSVSSGTATLSWTQRYR